MSIHTMANGDLYLSLNVLLEPNKNLSKACVRDYSDVRKVLLHFVNLSGLSRFYQGKNNYSTNHWTELWFLSEELSYFGLFVENGH